MTTWNISKDVLSHHNY